MLPGLREDALTLVDGGFELRMGLPWIRSLPLAGVTGLRVAVDGRPLDEDLLRVRMGSRLVRPAEVAQDMSTWWYLQDRLVLVGGLVLEPGLHDVTVDLRVAIPYLPVGADVLVLPLRQQARLATDQTVSPDVSRDVCTPERPA